MTLPERVTMICCIICIGGMLCWCLITVIDPRPLTCCSWSWKLDKWKCGCLKIGSDVRGGENATPEPTATDMYPQATYPENVYTETPIAYTSTPEPYPPQATDWTPKTPVPYPLPDDFDWLYLWRR